MMSARKRLWDAWTLVHALDDVETVTVSKHDLHELLQDEVQAFSVITRIRALVEQQRGKA